MTDPYSMSMFGMGPAANAASDDPEAFQLLQNERNRQMLANLMLSRGMQQPQGQMVGRFYVPPSPAQHLGGLVSAGLGAYMMGQQGKGLSGLADKRNAARVQAIQKYIADTSGENIPAHTLPQGSPGQPSNLEEIFGNAGQIKEALGTPPQINPYQGGSQLRIPGAQAQAVPPAMQDYQPGTPEVPAMYGPVNDAIVIPPDPNKAKAAVLEALTNNDPRVRESVKFMEQQRATQEEKAAQRDLLKTEKEMDRELKREGIEANVATRLEQMKNTAALTAMQIDARDRAGQDSNELKKALADQTAEIKKMELASRERMAREANEARKEIAGMKASAGDDKKIETKQAGHQQVQLLTAQLRDYYNQLREGSGITDVEGGTLGNIGAGIASSGPGQTLGGLLGTKNQSVRNSIAQQRPLLMQSIMKASGMTAKQMDSNVELKLWLSTATDPTLGYQANMRALDMLEKLYGGGDVQDTAPAQTPSTGDLTPDEQKELEQLRKRFRK